MLFKKNVQLLAPLKNISIWRKVSLGVWRNACEAAIYSRLEIDATALLKKKAELKQRGYVISVATFVGKAVAQSILKYPLINSIIRFNRIYPRQETNICFQVATGKNAEDLSTLRIKNCDQLSLTDISEQLRQRSLDIRDRKEVYYAKRTLCNKLLPGFLVRLFINITGFILYTLNIRTSFYETDPFGSALVSSLAMFNIDNAFVPLIPYCRCPIVIAIGKIQKKAVVADDNIVIKPIIEICVTLDHRLVDAAGACKLLKYFKQYLENPT